MVNDCRSSMMMQLAPNGRVLREIAFGFAQGGLSSRWWKRGTSGWRQTD